MNSRLNDWKLIATAPVDEQLARFRQAVVRPQAEDVNGGLRAFAAGLLAQGLIDMNSYVAVLGGHALNCLTPDGTDRFRDMSSGASASELTAIYSRAKYGSQKDIRFLAGLMIHYLERQLDDPASHWARLFTSAREHNDNVVLMTTGWRNVPSTANVLYDIVVEEINVKLAHMGLPTLINVKLPRIAPPCENYASLSTEERERVNLVQDHVIPAENFYRWSGVHVIFGDDVLVTGSTADKVLRESLLAGARSFQAIYPVAIDPRVALADATVEEHLNMVEISHHLDDKLAELLMAADYQPILRTLRLLFSADNYQALPAFLERVPAANWLRLYKAALGNEFLRQTECIPSLTLLRHYLENLGLLRCSGVTAERPALCV
ncbi:hypothetical protein PS865_04360 [Pseudomonas fluorescens]|uniref:hypothetical protein n=1 Tax=Pseudomonas fluorescens TaxID=294 RepID=UPI001242CEF2|nr:hypothetical protein [Pseudomonas fluorescens]VVP31010.1 hypothetical protein PS865_04360 [Pseudomonas fluorescens]